MTRTNVTIQQLMFKFPLPFIPLFADPPIIIIITLSLSKAEKICKEVELISEYRRRNTGWMTFQNPNRTCLVSKTISRISGCTVFDFVDIDNMQKGKRETDVSTSVRLR